MAEEQKPPRGFAAMDPERHRTLSAKGGRKSRGGGFAADRERAREAGRKGGRIGGARSSVVAADGGPGEDGGRHEEP